ncbi:MULTISPECIES: rhodanese-like domain-containing protein [Nitrosomonas]|uniref:Rhodanese-like domain-containing protein n=1 Tax=Nitrosomonas communis TaxID=44574 RepID=A0A5D3YDW6_9PROT|nr:MULTISPECIES: rhodanese-like domain-containing protein [Nitrosomonas]TYP90216.1 rhodanese-like domain-containing protein [Nitrosomonas communis]UVS63353.1 rhodanese-like domain-containing protein [Nitrosomonas sp. PLL12]
MVLLLSWQLTAHASTPAEMAPEQVTGTITINTETTKLLFDKGYLFVDVRKLENFNQGHIPAAQHLAVRSALFIASNLAVLANKDQMGVFYCNGIH